MGERECVCDHFEDDHTIFGCDNCQCQKFVAKTYKQKRDA